MKAIKKIGKKIISVLLVLSILLSFTVSVSAAESPTAAKIAPNTAICDITGFGEDDFSSVFIAWKSKTPTKIIENGILKLVGGGNNRNAGYMVQTPSTSQYVSMTFNPKTNEASRPILWLKTKEFDRGTSSDNIVPIGYNIKCQVSGTNITTYLYKNYINDNNAYSESLLSQVPAFTFVSSSGIEMPVEIEAFVDYDSVSDSNLIKVNIFRVLNDQRFFWTSINIEDNESELLSEGWAGFANASANTVSVDITSFKYHSTDKDIVKEIYSTSDFSDYLSNTIAWQNNTHSTVVDGKLNVEGNTQKTDRDSARFLIQSGENLQVSATVKTPHYYDGTTLVKVASSPVVWLKTKMFLRDNNVNTPVGYFVRAIYTTGNQTVKFTLCKQTCIDNKLQAVEILATSNDFDILKYGTTTIVDFGIDASIVYNAETGKNDMVVKIKKNGGLVQTLEVSDEDQALNGVGTAGLGTNSTDSTFTYFNVKSKDESLVSNAYVETNSARSNTMLAQPVNVDTTATYEFCAIADGDFTQSPLCIAYKGNGNDYLYYELTPTMADAVDTHYNRYTYNVDFSELGVTNAKVYVGVKMQETGETPNHIKFSEFEFRKIENNVLGVNLLVNGDFRMGACGWEADAITSAFNTASIDVSTFDYDRFLYMRDINENNYRRLFINDDYMGDVNEDSTIDIRDLVRAEKVIAAQGYAIFGDLDGDNTFNAGDLVSIRVMLLSNLKKN